MRDIFILRRDLKIDHKSGTVKRCNVRGLIEAYIRHRYRNSTCQVDVGRDWSKAVQAYNWIRATDVPVLVDIMDTSFMYKDGKDGSENSHCVILEGVTYEEMKHWYGRRKIRAYYLVNTNNPMSTTKTIRVDSKYSNEEEVDTSQHWYITVR